MATADESAPVPGTDLEPNWDFDLRILDPAQVRLFRAGGLPRMTLEGDRSWIRVQVVRALPISAPDRYIGLLDGGGSDIGIIRDPAQLDARSRAVVDEELELRYFVPVVTEVLSVKEEYATVYWDVETTRGRKDIVVRNMRDNLQELGASRIIVTDVDGNRFEFPDINALDPKSLNIILRRL